MSAKSWVNVNDVFVVDGVYGTHDKLSSSAHGASFISINRGSESERNTTSHESAAPGNREVWFVNFFVWSLLKFLLELLHVRFKIRVDFDSRIDGAMKRVIDRWENCSEPDERSKEPHRIRLSKA